MGINKYLGVIGIIFSILLLSSLTSATLLEAYDTSYTKCFQQTANVSTSCGGLSTGYYTYDKLTGFSDPSYGIDGNTGTAASSLNFNIINSTYRKPIGAQSNSTLWFMPSNTALQNNYSIPSECWNYDANYLYFGTGISAANLTIYCWLGDGNYKLLYSVYSDWLGYGGNFREEAMNWELQTPKYRNVSFGLCNASLTTPYINFSFKDSNPGGLVTNASIDSLSIFWSTPNATSSETYTYSSAAENASYGFCSNQPATSIVYSLDIQYRNSLSYAVGPLPFAGTATNLTDYFLLYLNQQGSGGGNGTAKNVTFITQEQSGAPITGVYIKAYSDLDGNLSLVAAGLTDSMGQIKIGLNPALIHSITATKSLYDDKTISINLAQDSYTIVMDYMIKNATYNATFKEGLTWSITKTGELCYNDVKNFEFNISSIKGNIKNATIVVKYFNGTVLNSHNGYNPWSNNLSVYINTSEGQRLYGYFYVTMMDNNITMLLDPARYTMLCVAQGEFSIKSFFESLRLEAGDNIEDTWTIMFWVFLFFVLGIASFTFMTGSELSSPMVTTLLVTIIIGILSYIGYFDLELVVNEVGGVANFLNHWSLFVIAAALSIGMMLGRLRDT